jgi:hypothetical protein
MHQSKGRKENLGDDFTTKGSNCLRLMIWQVRSDLFWCFWLSCNRNYTTAIFKKMYDALKTMAYQLLMLLVV